MKLSGITGLIISSILMIVNAAEINDSTTLNSNPLANQNLSSVTLSINGNPISIGGYAALENGQFVKCNYFQTTLIDRPWVSKSYGELYISAKVGEHLTVIAAPEVDLWFDTYPYQTMGNVAFTFPYNQRSTVYLADAEGILSYGSKDDIALKIAAGVMPFKYNEDVKNLGEYLFRTGARPAYIYTSFDYPYATLTGLHVNIEPSMFLKNFSFDAFLTMETRVQPQRDWSLSFLAGYKIPSILNVGAGVMFDRLFPVNGNVETPIDNANSYLDRYGIKQYYSFGGTKLDGRISINPVNMLFSGQTIFPPEQCNIYAEATILGLKSNRAYKFPTDSSGNADSTMLVIDSSKNWYSDIKKRIPVMFGISLPTWKVFDYLSMEFEYYAWPYPDSYGTQGFNIMLPQPAKIGSGSTTVYDYQVSDNWKYSFNVKKTITKGFSVIGQIARDHTHHDIYYPTYEAKDLYEEIFTQKDNWGWWLKLQYSF